MIIEIKDIAINVKKITLEFDNNGETQTSVEVNESNNIKFTENENYSSLDLNFGNSQTVSQEIIEKPEIPDKKRDVKISETMQGLKI